MSAMWVWRACVILFLHSRHLTILCENFSSFMGVVVGADSLMASGVEDRSDGRDASKEIDENGDSCDIAAGAGDGTSPKVRSIIDDLPFDLILGVTISTGGLRKWRGDGCSSGGGSERVSLSLGDVSLISGGEIVRE